MIVERAIDELVRVAVRISGKTADEVRAGCDNEVRMLLCALGYDVKPAKPTPAAPAASSEAKSET